ncbi:TrmH family RNA methyltransferase [Spongiivirga sp. MCCC 1A20706]|uniref:TrmH family RNA methyltransferase n=1 Tax=Spongiivirga sp. MCCC 1A20706 TaxID=3160963 RepID=UPI0039777FBE
MSQRTHYNTNFEKKQLPITLIADGVSLAPNIGSLFRIADAFGVEQLLLCNAVVDLQSKRVLKTARATIDHVAHKHIDHLEDLINMLKNDGYLVVALEITENSIPLGKLDLGSFKKIALVVGGENFGVSESVLTLSNEIIHIPMYGNNSSMNVSQATAITLYELSNALINRI